MLSNNVIVNIFFIKKSGFDDCCKYIPTCAELQKRVGICLTVYVIFDNRALKSNLLLFYFNFFFNALNKICL